MCLFIYLIFFLLNLTKIIVDKLNHATFIIYKSYCENTKKRPLRGNETDNTQICFRYFLTSGRLSSDIPYGAITTLGHIPSMP